MAPPVGASLSWTGQKVDRTHRETCNGGNRDSECCPNEATLDCPRDATWRSLLRGSYGEKPSNRSAHAPGQRKHGPAAETAQQPAHDGSHEGGDDGAVRPGHSTPGKHPHN